MHWCLAELRRAAGERLVMVGDPVNARLRYLGSRATTAAMALTAVKNHIERSYAPRFVEAAGSAAEESAAARAELLPTLRVDNGASWRTHITRKSMPGLRSPA